MRYGGQEMRKEGSFDALNEMSKNEFQQRNHQLAILIIVGARGLCCDLLALREVKLVLSF